MQGITRRETLKTLLAATGSLACAGPLCFRFPGAGVAKAHARSRGFLVEVKAAQPDYEVKALVRKVFDAAGGIGRFVSRGDVVAVKPNISWARP